MTETKMTYANALTQAIEVVGAETPVGEKLIALKEQLAHKAENRKPRVNKEKAELAEKVVAIMEPGVAYRTAELAKILGVSTQKLTPALGVAVENGNVAKAIEKRVAKYQLVTE
jgi:hypothetical protein